MYKIKLIVLFSFFFGSILNSQWIHYTSENTKSIPGIMVSSIIQDHEGLVWFGTNEGLVKYDQKNAYWSIYGADNGMLTDFIYKVYKDSDGNIWAATNGGGVSKYDRKRWTNYTIKHGLPSNFIRSIAQSNTGDMWFGTYGDGLVSFNDESGFSKITHPDIQDTYVMSLLALDNGAILIGTKNKGLLMLQDTVVYSMTKDDGLLSNYIQCIYQSWDDSIWIGSDMGAQIVNIETWTVSTPFSELLNIPIYSMASCFDRELYIGSKGKIKIISDETVSDIPITGINENEAIYSVSFSEEEIIWFGTGTQGAIKLEEGTWSNYTHGNGLLENRITSICEDKDGNMWFTSNSGVSQFDGIKWISFQNPGGGINYGYNNVCCDLEGNIWLHSQYDIRKYDGETWKICSDDGAPQSEYITHMEVDGAGNIWVKTPYRLYKFNGKIWKKYTKDDGVDFFGIVDVEVNPNGDVFIIDLEGEVYKFEDEEWNLVHSDSSLEGVNCLLVDAYENYWIGAYNSIYLNGLLELELLDTWQQITDIKEDAEGNIWFLLSFNGIIIRKGSHWQSLTTINGLSGRYNYDVFFDSKQTIWIASSTGIDRSVDQVITSNVEDYAQIDILDIYPNPFSDILNIMTYIDHDQPLEIHFYTMEGELFHSVTTQVNGIKEINTSSWPSGIYVCNYIFKNNNYTQKIIK